MRLVAGYIREDLNLASQSVLEGLNACLDHRAEVYIPELGMAFRVQKGQTRLFACQNPLNQGGGRKGLPKSFLNRFTQVYVEPLSKSDLLFITGALYPRIDASVVDKMVTFNMKVHRDSVVEGKWGRKGSPWEFNLRDVFRWCDLLIKHQSPGFWNPGQFVRLIYSDRMRTVKDKQMVVELFKSVFDSTEQMEDIRNIRPSFHITPFHVQVGHSWLPRCAAVDQASITAARPLQVLHQCLPTMESLMKCVEMNWMTVLVGSRSCGKTSLVHLLAQLTGNKLEVMAMNSAMDTTELLGGFEQADLNRQWGEIVTLTKDLVLSVIRETLLTGVAIPRCLQEMSLLYKLWIGCSGQEKEGDDDSSRDLLSLGKMDAFLSLLESVENICRSIGFNSFSAESLRDMLQSLRQRLIANGDSSHCSGQFEWVDGQLVEALKSGHWLLIDNVNFCRWVYCALASDSQMLDLFPVDLRMNKDLFDQLNQTQSNASLLDAISGVVNRLSLLELEARRCYVEGDSCHPVNSPRRNLLQLSSAYQSGQVQMERLPHPVVVHLLPFFKSFSSFLEFCISQERQLTDTHYWTVIDGLVWRDRLWRTCQKLSRENFTMSSLSLHWTWVVQHTLNSVPVAFGLLDYRQLPSELVSVINQLNGILATGSGMAEVFYKILTAYGHPPPFRSKLSSEIWERLQHLCQKIDRFPDKLRRGANEERLRDLQRKLVSVFRDGIENRLQDGHLQCASVIQSLDETVDSMLMQARDTVLHDAESCEIARPPTDNSTTSEAEMGKTLLALFESICSLQEHTVLATLMSGLANQMACRATFRQIEKVEEQMQSLTAYQLNKTSRKPETTARYQYLQAIFPQGDNLSENFDSIFKPVESDLLCNYWLLKSSSLWSQNVQGQLALVPEQLTTPDEKMISSLCQCPNPRSSSSLDLAISLTSYSMQTIIQALVKCFCVDDQASSISALLSYRVVRLSLLNVQIHSLKHGFLDQKTHQALNSILVIFLDKWRIYQEQERQREEEEGSLFKYKDRSHGSNMSEEEENELAVHRVFPSFDSEFKDIMVQDDLNDSGEQPQLENTRPPESLLASNAELFMAAMKDYSEIRSVHEEMFCRLLSSRDLSFGVKDSCLNSSEDALYRQAFEWGYQTAGMLKAITPWLATEAQLSCSHILQSCILQGNFEMQSGSTLHSNFPNTVGDAKGGRPFNIYHDSNIQEAVKVKPVLQGFAARVQELLVEWPRHPNLVQLTVVIERILSFPVTSPLMRLLTGLEVLLKKSQGYDDEDLQLASSCEALGLSLPTGHSRLPKLFQKMRKLSSQLLNERGYMQRVLSLDDFTGEVISRSKELQALDVMNQPKEKRKELGKHIQQRKRKSLSDLFKILSSIGVSYRKGLNLERQSTSKESMTLAAVDEEAVVNSVSLLSDRPSDLIHKVSQLAHGCCHHFFKALARSAAFDVIIVTPSKELGIGEIDRCKGCTSHLLHVCYEQRKVISRFSQDIRNASVCLKQLSQIVDFTSDGQRSRCSFLPPQAELQRRTVRVMDLLTCASQVLQQMFTLLRCCPDDANESSPPEWSPFPQSMLSSVALSSSSDDVVTDLVQKLKEATNEVQRLAKDIRPYAAVSDHVLHNSRQDDTTAFVTSWRQFDKVEKAFFKLQNISEVIAGMLPRFESKCCHIDQGFGGALVDLKNKVLKECDDFFTWRENTLGGGDEHEFWNTEESHEQAMATVDSFFGDVDSLNTSLLLATQRLAKIAENSGNENTEVGETADEEPDFENFQLQDKHLTTLLHQNLLEEINSLHMGNVSKGTKSLLSRLRAMADNAACGSFLRKSADLCAQMLGTSIPFLHQFLSLSQHLLVNLLASHRATSKLLSVLFSIFTDLASKGFCLPPEIEEGEGEGPTEFEDIEEGGLGEGEGIKDVSDQIESEDQLDETKREGQEQDKKEEDQEQIPDEENGIEMSENFDGALHDLEVGEDQDDEKSEDENEEENELDKQMGEVDGQEAEKLDEKMWGDSDEEDEQEVYLVYLLLQYNRRLSITSSVAMYIWRNKSSVNLHENMAAVSVFSCTNIAAMLSGQEEMETDEFEGDKGKEENAEDEMPADDDQLCGDKDKSDQQAMADEEDTEQKDESEKHRDGEMPNDEIEDDSSDGDQEDWRTKSDTKSQENVQAVEDSGQGDGSGEQSEETAGQSESTEGSEERGLGQADAADSEGHCGKSSTAQVPVNANQQLKESRQRKQMNRARSDRALGSMDETTHKRLKTVDDAETNSNAEANEAKRQDLFQHIQNDESTNYDAQTLDSATADQAEEQEKGNFPDMDSEADKDEDDDYEMQSAFLEDKDEFPTPERPQQSRMLPPVKPRSTEDTEQEEEAETENREEDMETNNPEEITADRLLSTYHSSEIALAFERMDISSLDPDKLRSVLEHQLAHWSNLDRGTIEEQQVAQEAWRKYEFLTAGLSQELCEQLRLVLEPALASKLKGDYRSGKRLNMRKVIPYIASQFRKDKIWLRRTKPSKRQYQIMLAVDDSSSMKDNHSKQLC
ncbi:PREDICTED: midasin-like [Acropora digitifera]|uniref:midasin-like n=1 Tax=Acropora digitifera TaxID=70779 RepID=UPI00077A9358|nr:PREDICTED: midasin-like [Acropora digitifera]